MNITIRPTGTVSSSKASGAKKKASATGSNKLFSDSLTNVAVTPVQYSTHKSKKKPKTAYSWGNQALEELEKIQMDLLVGGIPISRLRQLKEMIDNQPVVINPDLKNVIDDIKLRVEIELAKYMS